MLKAYIKKPIEKEHSLFCSLTFHDLLYPAN